MRALRAPLLAVALVLASAPASAEDKNTREEVERLAREAAERIVAALEVILQAIPQYELPEIQPNGDIIIRRRNPPPELPPGPPKEKPEPPATGGQDPIET